MAKYYYSVQKLEAVLQSDWKMFLDACGIGFFTNTMLLWIDDEQERTGVVSGAKVMDFFARLPKPRPDHISFLLFKRGSIAVPLRSPEGELVNLQCIGPTGTKLYPKYGRKQGCMHLLEPVAPDQPIALAEGYATAASVFMATGWPTAVAFDAGNLPPVASSLRKRYPDHELIICDDRDENGAGESFAREAAKAVGKCVVVCPAFEGEG